jgi:uncharacterized protein (TIGR01777 family)
MKIIISGARGFIGSHLVPALQSAGHDVAIWSRTPSDSKYAGVDAHQWDPVAGPPPVESLEGVDAVIHLAGESVAHKWTPELKRRIRESRVTGTRNLVESLSRAATKPQVLVCSSATGYYGDRGEEELTEASAPGTGFLPEVCTAWEQEADQAASLGIRVTKIRTGMVLGHGGGALARLVGAFKTKMGGKLASGKQWMSWIHMADLVGLYRYAVEHDIHGAFNGTSPHPVRNEAFTEALGEAIHEPSKVTIPEFALKMMFGEMSEVMLASQRVFPEATLKAGYGYCFSDLWDALRDATAGS